MDERDERIIAIAADSEPLRPYELDLDERDEHIIAIVADFELLRPLRVGLG